jgi:hypothetical protein
VEDPKIYDYIECKWVNYWILTSRYWGR